MMAPELWVAMMAGIAAAFCVTSHLDLRAAVSDLCQSVLKVGVRMSPGDGNVSHGASDLAEG